MKKITYLMLLALLFSVFSLIPAQKAYSFKAIVKVKLSSNSTVTWANLRINGKFKGKIYRGRIKFLNAFTGKAIRIEARNGTLVATRTVRARRGLPTVVLTLRRVERKGTLRVTLSDDSDFKWANIFINGRRRGKIHRNRPRAFSLASKNHTVKLQNGRVQKTRNVRVTPRRISRVTLTLKRAVRYGRIQVHFARRSQYRRATIFINDVNKGAIKRGRKRVFRVKVGTHAVKLQNGEVEKTRNVRVTNRRTTRVALALKMRVRYGRIQVHFAKRSQYRRATIFINDVNKGAIKRGRKRVFRVKVGTHTVTIKRRGKRVDKTVDVRANSIARVRLALRSRKGKVVLYYKSNSQYRRANILVDDNLKGQIRRGQTKTLRLSPGRHTVTIQKGRRKASRVVRVRPGRTVNVTLSLVSLYNNVRITYRGGAYSWAYLFINDRTGVRIQSGQTKTVRLSGDKSHTIGVYRLGRVNSKTLAVGSNRRRITLRIR